MNYSLATHRKYGDYLQKVTVIKNKSTVSSTILTELKEWADLVSSVDNNIWEAGELVCDVMKATQSFEGGNTGQNANVKVQVVSNVTGKPNIVMFEMTEVTKANFAGKVTGAVNTVIGVNLTSTETGIINTTIELY